MEENYLREEIFSFEEKLKELKLLYNKEVRKNLESQWKGKYFSETKESYFKVEAVWGYECIQGGDPDYIYLDVRQVSCDPDNFGFSKKSIKIHPFNDFGKYMEITKEMYVKKLDECIEILKNSTATELLKELYT